MLKQKESDQDRRDQDRRDQGRSGVQVISRAADILRALKNNQSGMSLGQIANRIDLPRSTVQRIVSALQAEQFIISDSNGGGLKLGPGLTALGDATKYNIVEQCRLLLTELTHETGETADLSVLRGGAMIFLDQVPGTHRLRTISSVGEVFPLTTTANGRACLSALPEDKARELILDEWERWNVDGQIDEFMEGLKEISENGLAYDTDDHTNGISAIGFSFKDWAGDVHAISVPVPSTRFETERENIERAIRLTAKHIDKMVERGDI